MGPRMQSLLDQINAFKKRRDEQEGVEHVPITDLRGRPLIVLTEEMAKLNERGDKFADKLATSAIEAAREAVQLEANNAVERKS